MLKDLYNKRQSLKDLENDLSELQNYGKVFKVLQKSNPTNIYILLFFDCLKNETKAKKILNTIFDKNILLKIEYNINLEELIQSIEESLPSKSF